MKLDEDELAAILLPPLVTPTGRASEVRYVSPEGWLLVGCMYWSDRTIPGRWEGCTQEYADACFARMRAELPTKGRSATDG